MPEAEDMLGNSNIERIETTLYTGLPEEMMGEKTSVWDAHNILNEAQHCRSGRGCSAALIHLKAALETAQDVGSGMFISSWDIQRAYDSLSKTGIKLLWVRLGLQEHIVNYQIAIGSQGKTLISTPVAYAAWAKESRKEMPPTTVDENLP